MAGSKREPYKAVIAVVAAAYFFWAVIRPSEWRLIDGVNLIIHEAGHPIFALFGEFIGIAGGTLLQIIVPTAFVLYFHFQAKPYSAALTLFWVGQSLANVSVYARDAMVMQLPLLGGDDSIHDWNYLLNSLRLLQSTPVIANMIQACALLTTAAAALLAWHAAHASTKHSLD